MKVDRKSLRIFLFYSAITTLPVIFFPLIIKAIEAIPAVPPILDTLFGTMGGFGFLYMLSLYSLASGIIGEQLFSHGSSAIYPGGVVGLVAGTVFWTFISFLASVISIKIESLIKEYFPQTTSARNVLTVSISVALTLGLIAFILISWVHRRSWLPG